MSSLVLMITVASCCFGSCQSKFSLLLFFESLVSHSDFWQTVLPEILCFHPNYQVVDIKLSDFFLLSWEILPTFHQDSDNGEFLKQRLSSDTREFNNYHTQVSILWVWSIWLLLNYRASNKSALSNGLQESYFLLLTFFSHSLYSAIALKGDLLSLCSF